MHRSMIATLSAAALALPAGALASTWEFDPAHTTASFVVRHMMVSNVRGQFNAVSGKLDLDDKAAEKSKVELELDVASINTNQDKRDAHLKSPDFFDAAKFPKILFKSKSIKAAGKNRYLVTGDLTIKDKTKEVKVDVETSPEMKGPDGTVKRGAAATAKINRKDFGLTWNMPLEGGGVVVGDEVTINFDVELNKKA